MIEKIYIACCATDVWLARICVASIRYWHPEAPVCLLRDFGRGRFCTREIEDAWSVTAADSEPRYSGWGYTKLELLFRPGREKFLFLDADTALVGPLLDVLHGRPEEFIVSPDPVDDPQRHVVMPYYFDYAKVMASDPAYEFPGWVFNAGQFVATSGIIRPEDFEPVVTWSAPPRLNRSDVFYSADQGFLNYLLVRKAAQGALALGTARLYYDARSDEALRLPFAPPARNQPLLLHWPGEKKAIARHLSRGEILDFFERHYYTRVPGGARKRAAREGGRRLARAPRRLLKRFRGLT